MASPRSSFARFFVSAVAIASVVAGCAQPGTIQDRSSGQKRTLRMDAATGINPNGQDVAVPTFITRLNAVSGGRLVVSAQEDFEKEKPGAESDLVAAVRDGRLDGAFIPTRALGAAGIHGLDALEAPFLVSSYAVEKALVSGPAAASAMSVFDGTGLVGLGMGVGPLRRPFSLGPALVSPAAWKDRKVRVFHSPVQAATVKALGADGVDASSNFDEAVRLHALDAAEIDAAQYLRGAFGTTLPVGVSNVVLWPKMTVFVLNQHVYDSLSDEQRGWLKAAVAAGVAASTQFPYDDSAVAAQLCGSGVRFATASAAQLSDLKAAVQPVLDGLAADPVTAPEYRAVVAAVAAHPGEDSITVPAGCAAGTR